MALRFFNSQRSGADKYEEVSDSHGLPVSAVCGPLTDRSGSIAVNNTAQQVCAQNSNRRFLLIQNNSAGTLWYNFGTTAVASQPSIQLSSGQIYAYDSNFIPSDLVSVIGAVGLTFTCKEG